jgi:DNA-binding beta-propeller fold protein YncE
MRVLILALCCAGLVFSAHIEQVAGGEAQKLVEPFAVDFGSNGEWYICEYKGQRIVRMPGAAILGGTGVVGNSGDGGPASAAAVRDPHGIAVSRDGRMYVADTLNHTIRRIDLKSGVITTIAGTGEKGFAGDGGPASKAQFNGTYAIALNRSGNRLYVADLENRRVRMIDTKTGVISTLAGNGQSAVPVDGSDAASSPLVDPRAVAVDSKGNVYILERRGNALRVVDTKGKIRTLISPGSVQPNLNGPKHLCVDGKGAVIIADAENNLIRKYDPHTGKTVTIAGTGVKGSRINPSNPLDTELHRPHGVAVDPGGALYISDSYNHRILKLSGY